MHSNSHNSEHMSKEHSMNSDNSRKISSFVHPLMCLHNVSNYKIYRTTIRFMPSSDPLQLHTPLHRRNNLNTQYIPI